MTTTIAVGRNVSLAGTEVAEAFSHDEIVFTVAEETYHWTDVVLFAMRSGGWADLETRVREGLACEERARATDGGPELSDLYAAADTFRRPEGLFTAEQLVAWLDRWGLTMEGWLGCVKRALLRDRWAAELPGVAARYPVSDEAVAAVVWSEIVCSGILSRSAIELAKRAAVAAALHVAEGDGEDGELADDAEAIVEKLQAQGFQAWALDDCRYRLERLGILDRRFEDFRSRVLASEMIREVTQPTWLDSIAFAIGGRPFEDAEGALGLAIEVEVDRHVRWHRRL